MKYIQVVPKIRIIEKEIETCPIEDEISYLLGQLELLNQVNYLHSLFSDSSLLLICSNTLEIPWTAVVQGKKHLFHPLLIFCKIPHVWGYSLGGLTKSQMALVRRELRFDRKSASQEFLSVKTKRPRVLIRVKSPFLSRMRLKPLMREELYGEVTDSSQPYRDNFFIINHKLKELSLLLRTKRFHNAEIRERIFIYGSSACLEQELQDQYEQIKILSQLAKDWWALLSLTQKGPVAKLEKFSEPVKALL